MTGALSIIFSLLIDSTSAFRAIYLLRSWRKRRMALPREPPASLTGPVAKLSTVTHFHQLLAALALHLCLFSLAGADGVPMPAGCERNLTVVLRPLDGHYGRCSLALLERVDSAACLFGGDGVSLGELLAFFRVPLAPPRIRVKGVWAQSLAKEVRVGEVMAEGQCPLSLQGLKGCIDAIGPAIWRLKSRCVGDGYNASRVYASYTARASSNKRTLIANARCGNKLTLRVDTIAEPGSVQMTQSDYNPAVEGRRYGPAEALMPAGCERNFTVEYRPLDADYRQCALVYVGTSASRNCTTANTTIGLGVNEGMGMSADDLLTFFHYPTTVNKSTTGRTATINGGSGGVVVAVVQCPVIRSADPRPDIEHEGEWAFQLAKPPRCGSESGAGAAWRMARARITHTARAHSRDTKGDWSGRGGVGIRVKGVWEKTNDEEVWCNFLRTEEAFCGHRALEGSVASYLGVTDRCDMAANFIAAAGADGGGS